MADVLADLLAEQNRRAAVVNDNDDIREMTLKLLKGAGRDKAIITNWTTMNPRMIEDPLCWMYLIYYEGRAAVTAINASLSSFNQRHLATQVSSIIACISTTLAFVPQNLNVYEAFTICEPLNQICNEQMMYLKAKRTADSMRMDARGTRDLIQSVREGGGIDAKIEEKARKISEKNRKRDRSL